MKKRTIILITIFSLAAVGGGGYGIYHLVKNGGSPVEVTSVANLNQGYWGSETSSSGTITSKANQEVHLDSNNVINQVYVKEGDKGPWAIISRTHPDMVKRMFEAEVPEIYDGTVEIKQISREAGARTKMAVLSKDKNVDAIGACIGPKGARVNTIVEELRGEKIDIIEYDEDPVKFIAAALAPAEVLNVNLDSETDKSCTVIVPNNQLSLAIGNKGQNARLAAKLTGWKIDIKPENETL